MDELGSREKQGLLQEAENALPIALSRLNHSFHIDLNPFFFILRFLVILNSNSHETLAPHCEPLRTNGLERIYFKIKPFRHIHCSLVATLTADIFCTCALIRVLSAFGLLCTGSYKQRTCQSNGTQGLHSTK